MSYASEMSEFQKKFANILVCSVLVAVTMFFLAFMGLFHYNTTQRIAKLEAQVHTLETGVSTVRIWNFETDKADVFYAAGYTTPVPYRGEKPPVNGMIIPVYMTSEAYDAGIDRLRLSAIQQTNKSRAEVDADVSNSNP